MKGASTHDGKMSGNRQLVEAYDHDHGKKSRHLSQRPKERGGESGGAHEPSGHDEIKQVVGEHGPAHAHHITRNEGGGYSSSTEHEDGYTHEGIEHDTLEHAHEHGAHAMDDTDHLGAGNADTEESMSRRHGIEHRSSGSRGGDHAGGGFMTEEG